VIYKNAKTFSKGVKAVETFTNNCFSGLYNFIK